MLAAFRLAPALPDVPSHHAGRVPVPAKMFHVEHFSRPGSASKALPLRPLTAVDGARRLRRISLERGRCGGKTLRAILEEKLCNSGVG